MLVDSHQAVVVRVLQVEVAVSHQVVEVRDLQVVVAQVILN